MADTALVFPSRPKLFTLAGVLLMLLGGLSVLLGIMPVSGRWRDLLAMLRRIAQADRVVFSVPLVAWKRMLAMPLVLLLFAFAMRCRIATGCGRQRPGAYRLTDIGQTLFKADVLGAHEDDGVGRVDERGAEPVHGVDRAAGADDGELDVEGCVVDRDPNHVPEHFGTLIFTE
jgi:hypothetical protein